MNRQGTQGKEQLDREAELETDEVLREIAEDARRLKNRYPKETVVPEGGE